MSISRKEYIEKCLQLSGFLLLLLLSVPPICQALLFFIDIPYRFEISLFVLVCIFIVLLYKSSCKSQFIYTVLVVLVVFAICFICAKYSFDSTDDGACYHKQAIGLLKEGWDPVFLSSFDYNDLTGSINVDIAHQYGGSLLWAEAYPKFSWYFSSFIYYFTDRIETGKISNFLFIYVLFTFTYTRVFQIIRSVQLRLLVSLLIALHPIAVIQSHYYYLDGICGCILMILMIVFADNYGKHWREILFTDKLSIFFLIIWGMNLKFSIALFCFLICSIFFVSSCVRLKTFLLSHCLFLSLVGLFSVFVVGFAPYLTNFLRHNELLYGFSSLNISDESCNSEFGVQGLNRIERSLASIFGKMSHGAIYNSLDELLKIPFTFDKSELNYYKTVDARVSAYGIYTGAIFLIISAVTIVSLIIKTTKNKVSLCQYLFIVAIYVELFAFTTSYQLRYIPHLYYIVMVVLCYLYESSLHLTGKISSFFCKAVLALLICCLAINIFPTGKVIKDSFKDGRQSEKVLTSTDKSIVYDVAFPHFAYTGLFYNLKDYGIRYNLLDRDTLISKFKLGHYKECEVASSYFIFICSPKTHK